MCKHLSSLQHDKTEFMGLNPNKPTKHLQFSKCSQQVYGLLKYRFINEHIGVSCTVIEYIARGLDKD